MPGLDRVALVQSSRSPIRLRSLSRSVPNDLHLMAVPQRGETPAAGASPGRRVAMRGWLQDHSALRKLHKNEREQDSQDAGRLTMRDRDRALNYAQEIHFWHRMAAARAPGDVASMLDRAPEEMDQKRYILEHNYKQISLFDKIKRLGINGPREEQDVLANVQSSTELVAIRARIRTLRAEVGVGQLGAGAQKADKSDTESRLIEAHRKLLRAFEDGGVCFEDATVHYLASRTQAHDPEAVYDTVYLLQTRFSLVETAWSQASKAVEDWAKWHGHFGVRGQKAVDNFMLMLERYTQYQTWLIQRRQDQLVQTASRRMRDLVGRMPDHPDLTPVRAKAAMRR